MADGFLGRWSKRKIEARDGKAIQAEAPAPQPSPEAAAGEEELLPSVQTQAQVPPPPTLDDVKALSSESDFSRFVTPEVAPEVKNAAMKKLFADPRYNVMDGMDVYVDDYTKADPIPESMMRKLASAQFLRLFEEKKDDEAGAPPRDVADDRAVESVAQSITAPQAVSELPVHADPDLRLQQDDAPPGEEPGHRAE